MVLAQRPLLVLTESRISRGRGGINLPVHACRSNSHFIFFLVVLFLSLPLVSFLFLGISFLNSYFLVMVPVVAPFFIHGKILFL